MAFVAWQLERLNTDKLFRFCAQASKIEAGELLLPNDAPWLVSFERELLGFTNLRQDDQANALNQLLACPNTLIFD